MLARRLLIFVAVLMGVAALTAAVAPRPPRVPTPPPVDQRAEPTPTVADEAGPAAAASPEPDVPGEPPLRRLAADTTRQRIEVAAGDRVRLSVSSRTSAIVQIGDEGPLEPVDPDAPARFDLLYEHPINIPILVRAPDAETRTIGELRVVRARG